MKQDWICTVRWVQATMSDGAWTWTMWLVNRDEDDKPDLTRLTDGVCMTKLGVYWEVWRICRRHGLRFRPNIHGTVKDEDRLARPVQ
jgi:hypothetical protein